MRALGSKSDVPWLPFRLLCPIRHPCMPLLIEQSLNGLQLGLTLFLLAAGLTLVFGIMGVINLAHGSFFMVGAYGAALVAAKTGSWLVGMLAGLIAAGLVGLLVEIVVVRRLYERDHLYQVLATFGLILFFNGGVALLFGRAPLLMETPALLSGFVEIVPGIPYPTYRLAVMAVGLLVAMGLWLLIGHSRIGMLIRAGATNRAMVSALGVDIGRLYTFVFGLGAVLAGLAGLMVGPIRSVQIGMGEQVLIMTFVVIVIGGIGSIKGALVGALLVGMADTLGRAFLPQFLKTYLSGAIADGLAATLSSVLIYLLMALVLIVRPRGLFQEAR
jgi:branched-chain amino acid transport system permease protein